MLLVFSASEARTTNARKLLQVTPDSSQSIRDLLGSLANSAANFSVAGVEVTIRLPAVNDTETRAAVGADY